jgi:type IV pilus assembly protein PilF
LGNRGTIGISLVASSLCLLACASRPKRDPDQSLVRYQLGVEYFRSRRVEAAVEELHKALDADPENAEAYNMLGIIALNQGADFVSQAEAADCLHGKDGELVREDAARRFREAEQQFRRAVALRPEFPDAWNNLSVAALHLQDWNGAVAAANEALKDSTYSGPELARANLGWAYLQMKQTQRAWKELHEAVSRAPKFCVGRYRLAKVYFERGDMAQAAENVDAVVDDARCPIQEAYLLGGLVHQRHQNRERARVLLRRCADLAPRSCVAGECRRYSELLR